MQSAREKYSEAVSGTVGYEETISRAFDKLGKREKELHGMIRSISEHSMHEVNQTMSGWLANDTYFKTTAGKVKIMNELATKLHELETHLTLWHAKKAYWLSSDETHALVYMADEHEHGLGFPPGLDKTAKEALEYLKARLP